MSVGSVTLSEESTGIDQEPPLHEKSRWLSWMRSKNPGLRWHEAEREWCWRNFEQHYARETRKTV